MILERIWFITFISAIIAAECIPLCAFLFAISFGCGFYLKRQADKQ